MADIVIVNPSSNMKTIARELSAYGKRVTCVRTSDMSWPSPERIFYFFAGYNACFTAEAQGEADKEDRVFIIKKGLLSRFRMWGVSKALGILNPELIKGNFIDLLMFRRGMLRCDTHKEDYQIFSNIDAVCGEYSEAKIITSLIPDSSGTKFCFWETDFDLRETFGSDYFVFFTGNSRIEAFCWEGRLVTATKEKKHIDHLIKVVPSLSKFEFKQVDEKSIARNYYPWLVKSSYPRVSLANDYSFFSTSIDMQSSWYGKLAATINFEKTK